MTTGDYYVLSSLVRKAFEDGEPFNDDDWSQEFADDIRNEILRGEVYIVPVAAPTTRDVLPGPPMRCR